MSKLLHLFLIFSTSFSKCLSFYNEYLTKPNENIGTSALKENNLGKTYFKSTLDGTISPKKYEKSISNELHFRQKRLLWITDDGRLAFPPGTSLSISPTLALPLVRYPPEGFFSNISISLPLTLDFDKLGLTDNQNPVGVLPPIFATHFEKAASNVLNEYIKNFIQRRSSLRKKREGKENVFVQITPTAPSHDEDLDIKLPENHKYIFHGGERAILYVLLEDFLNTLGMDGKACLLRAICEVHSKSLRHFGLVGEIMKVFLSASHSPYSHLMKDYVIAEKRGRREVQPEECFPYFKDCPKSLFRETYSNKYRYMQMFGNEDNMKKNPYQTDLEDNALYQFM